MKSNDIYVCAFPKSGISYLGFLLVAARLHHNRIALKPTMYNVDFLLIDIHKMANTPAGAIWRDGLGDLYKTHKPFFPVPNVVYLLRNPVDTLRSFFHFRRQLGSGASAREFLTGSEGISAWINHVKSWLLDNRNVSQSLFVTEYETVMADPQGELQALAAQLGLEFSAETLEFAIQAAGIQRMRDIEASFAARNPVYAQFNLEFVRRTDNRDVADITPELTELIRTRAQPYYELIRNRLAVARKANQRSHGA